MIITVERDCMLKVSDNWKDYECIDASDGEKVERYGTIILRRPDPQIIWGGSKNTNLWNDIHGHYFRSDKGGGHWKFKKKVPNDWTIQYKDLTFKIAPTGFKHTGIFPEQAINWDFMSEKIKMANRTIHVLNLFAYTGGATIACAKAGAHVVHVDASKGMVEWAKENAKLSGLQDHPIRYIVDDCLKFVKREQRRGHVYDAIIMDPPSYGRGPDGELWKFEHQIQQLVFECQQLLSSNPLFFQINSYTTGISPLALENMLQESIFKKQQNGMIESGEVGLPITNRQLVLPCGIYARWSSNDSDFV